MTHAPRTKEAKALQIAKTALERSEKALHSNILAFSILSDYADLQTCEGDEECGHCEMETAESNSRIVLKDAREALKKIKEVME